MVSRFFLSWITLFASVSTAVASKCPEVLSNQVSYYLAGGVRKQGPPPHANQRVDFGEMVPGSNEIHSVLSKGAPPRKIYLKPDDLDFILTHFEALFEPEVLPTKDFYLISLQALGRRIPGIRQW